MAGMNLDNRSQTNLNRAPSTAYYALFHAHCLNCADSLVGVAGTERSQRVWLQAYRAVEHAKARKKCNRIINEIMDFPDGIITFTFKFVELQEKRYLADYDPLYQLTHNDVLNHIASAEVATIEAKGPDGICRMGYNGKKG